MLKLFGALLVILGGTVWGIRKYTFFLLRKNMIYSIYDGLAQVENSLRCTCAPLHECFKTGGDFFNTAAEKIAGGYSPEDAVIESASAIPSLTGEDMNVIRHFAKGLNADDCKGQVDNLILFKSGLDKQLTHAANELQSKGKLYIKGSILTAAAVVLLLL